jgi:3-oxo-5-alpha-steroid 4-dehydrogenase 1
LSNGAMLAQCGTEERHEATASMSWYTGDTTYDTIMAVALGFAAAVAIAAWFVPSPYGRFTSGSFGWRVDPRLGWFLMELPASIVFAAAYLSGPRRAELVPMVLAGIWVVHYANRGFFFPFMIRTPRGASTSFSFMVVAIGWLSTTLHGYLNGAFVAGLGAHLTTAWLSDPRFWAGAGLWAASLALNVHSDAVVRNLRTRREVSKGEKVYRIPRGGLFRWVTNASYLTELGAWAGWALATWSLAGVYILALSAANLLPRAVATHRWYRERFPDYPTSRKILVPFVW